MNFGHYQQLLSQKSVRRLLLVAILARVPHAAAGLILTLHVVNSLGLDYTAAGGVTAAVTLGISMGAPWRGRILDRKGLRRTLIPSIIAEVVIWSTAGFLPYFLLLVAAFIGGALAVPVFTVVRKALAVMVSQQQRRTAYTLDSISSELTFIIGPALGVILATVNSHLALIVVGVASSAAGAFLYWFNPPTHSGAPGTYQPEKEEIIATEETLPVVVTPGSSLSAQSRLRGWGRRLRGNLSWFTMDVAVVLATATGAGLMLIGTDIAMVATVRSYDRQGDIGIVFAAWGLASIIGGLIYGAMQRRINPLSLLLGMALLTFPLALATDTLSLVLLAMPAGLLVAPVLAASSERLADLVPEHRRGEAMGWYGSALTLGAALGAPLTGAVMDATASWVGFLAIAGIGLMIALIGVLVTLLRHRKSAQRSDAVRNLSRPLR
ncbi:MFS transporter [Acaricomes phytoseiuli]|uniref:MFS transporter n=1 Tax=Acaricomes phytoseiuli TaxID=291968 RepID=UPI000374BC12|nr:MFS transporter [Acaricomes phytoseiuli]MCW1248828.1 MFS transporter [Acaricomes phytoseiuli]